MIGIRQADGSFYEILGDAQAGRKRLVLSAARRDQRGVKIDLYRSVNGTLEGADSLGTISLDDPEGLGFQDIEFHVDLGADDQLSASAALPGQAPRTLSVDLSVFHSARSDQAILGDESFADADLDTLDDSFGEAMTLDLPDSEPDEPARRSDADILGDESLDTVELDTLEEFSFGEGLSETEALSDEPLEDSLPEPMSESADEAFGLPDLDLTSMDLDLPSEDLSLPPDDLDSPAESFDLGDLDAGFGTEEEPLVAEEAATVSNPAEDWEKVSFDDLEAMEFLDTGDEISAPQAKEPPPAENRQEADPFAIDHDDPLDLGDYDTDLSGLSDLPDLGDLPETAAPASDPDDFDQDFLPPAALTESDSWEEESPPPQSSKAPKAAKPPKPAKVPGGSETSRQAGEPGGLDKTALVLSLATLSLLLLLIIVLLFLNLIKAPHAPVVQPEVMRWKPTAEALAPQARSGVAQVDLAAADPEIFEAASVLEVPANLRAARVALTLVPGDTPSDAARRFGEPARRQGNQLFW
jgi:hypothetical protein